MTDRVENKELPKFKGNLILKGKIECLTGLHIGSSKEKLQIGGIDSFVLRNPKTEYPYIPGSSLKGKMRYLLEYSLGVVGKGAKSPGDVSQDEYIVRLFGIGADDKDDKKKCLERIGPTRLIVRDCEPDDETIKMWDKVNSSLLFTEYKAENTIDRLTSAANPRFIERVVAGSFFNFEIIYSLYEMAGGDKDKADTIVDVKNLMTALRLVESSALGKSGSRGYGKVKFHLLKKHFLEVNHYKEGGDKYKEASQSLEDKELTKPGPGVPDSKEILEVLKLNDESNLSNS